MNDEGGTWHYGLVARYWAEFNRPEPKELAYYRAAIERFGQPALDLGCGVGRLLVPLLAAGLEVDGVDISEDMLALCREQAERQGVSPRLERQAFHQLEMPRRYGTIYICDSFGIGGRRDRDLETLRRIRDHLQPGGALVFSLELPYNTDDEIRWGRWLPGHRDGLPRALPDEDERQRAENGDEYELSSRRLDLDPLKSWERGEMRTRLFRDGTLIAEEFGRIDLNLYFVPEVRLMLSVAGFDDVSVEGRYTGLPAEADDGTVVFVARASSPGLSASSPSA